MTYISIQVIMMCSSIQVIMTCSSIQVITMCSSIQVIMMCSSIQVIMMCSRIQVIMTCSSIQVITRCSSILTSVDGYRQEPLSESGMSIHALTGTCNMGEPRCGFRVLNVPVSSYSCNMIYIHHWLIGWSDGY